MIEKIGDRLKIARIKLGLSRIEIADKINIKADKVKDIETSRHKLTTEIAELLAETCNINPGWLMFSRGNMLLTNENSYLSNGNEDLIEFNYYPEVYASAGYGVENGHEIQTQKMFLDRGFVNNVLSLNNAKNLDIIKVVGDSMEPFVKNGEQVVIQREIEAKNNDVVIANINGNVYVKRILMDPFKNWIKLISDNEHYPPIEISGDEIDSLNIIGIVKAKIKIF